jgi:hypothetical protein
MYPDGQRTYNSTSIHLQFHWPLLVSSWKKISNCSGSPNNLMSRMLVKVSIHPIALHTPLIHQPTQDQLRSTPNSREQKTSNRLPDGGHACTDDLHHPHAKKRDINVFHNAATLVCNNPNHYIHTTWCMPQRSLRYKASPPNCGPCSSNMPCSPSKQHCHVCHLRRVIDTKLICISWNFGLFYPI